MVHIPKVSTAAGSVSQIEYLQTTVIIEMDKILYLNKDCRQKRLLTMFSMISNVTKLTLLTRNQELLFSVLLCIPAYIMENIFTNLRIAIREASDFQLTLMSTTAQLTYDHDISTTEKIDNLLNLVYFITIS